MKKRFLPLLMALFVLTLSFTVQADTTITQYLNTLTGDEFYGKDIPTSGSYGTVATSAAAGTFTVIEEADSNKAYQFAGGATDKKAMTIYTYSSKAADNILTEAYLQKMSARVKFSSTAAQTQLFTLGRTWSVAHSADTGGVLIKNGGAYHYDVSEGTYVNFIEDGTLSTDTWYTVELVYDFTNPGNFMSASVYDENGIVVDTSAWTKVSEFARYSSKISHIRTYITFASVPADETVLIDDVAIYTLSELSLISCTDAVYDEENKQAVFTFDDTIDTDLITEANVRVIPANSALDVAGKYSASVSGDTITVDLSSLPYGEEFTVEVSGYALSQKAQCTLTTPEDPFEKAVTNIAFEAEDGEAIAAGDNVVATVTLENASNADKDYLFVVTSWNSKDECVAIRALSGNIKVGVGVDEDHIVTLPAVPFQDADSIVRVSLVDNWYNMTPIGDAFTFELGGN